MKKWMTMCTLLALVSVVTWGCAQQKGGDLSSAPAPGGAESHDDHGHSHDNGDHDHAHEGDHDHAHGEAGHGETVEVALKYCGDCGHGFAKGSEHTCDADHEKCAACGMHKGAELCCKLEGDFAGKALCGSCGQVAGSDVCCKEGAEVCAGCNLHKGSPLCCKLGQADAPAAPEAPAEPAAPAAPEEGEG